MLVLFETSAGFALFKVLQEGKLKEATDLWQEFSTLDSAQSVSEAGHALSSVSPAGQRSIPTLSTACADREAESLRQV